MSRQIFKRNNEKLCRICLKDDKFKISIFCDYAQKLNIHSRIQKYLQIKIFTHDELPKYICYHCLTNLEFIENFINKAQDCQNAIDTSEKSSENTFFEDQSLQTPPENYSQTQIKHINKNSMKRRHSISIVEPESDSEKLFKPKMPNKPRTMGRNFPSNEDSFKSDFKKLKIPSQLNMDITTKTRSEHESDDSEAKRSSLQKKKSIIKSYNEKFKSLRNTSA